MLTHDEAFAFLRTGTLPDGFAGRVESFLEFETCTNCGGVRCMHFVMRDWWAEDFDACDRFCCPFCGEYARGAAAAESVAAFLRAPAAVGEEAQP